MEPMRFWNIIILSKKWSSTLTFCRLVKVPLRQLFIHVFFVLLYAGADYALYGRLPGICTRCGSLYYSAVYGADGDWRSAMLTSALVVFFRGFDRRSWQYLPAGGHLDDTDYVAAGQICLHDMPVILKVFKLNPMCYIV